MTTLSETPNVDPPSAERRFMIISADGHAGGEHAAPEYRPYVDSRYLDDYDAYVAAVRQSDMLMAEAIAEGRVGRSAFNEIADERDLEPGLIDPNLRMAHLEADGIVAEVIFPQGSIPFAPYPPLGDPRRKQVDVGPDLAMRAAGVRAYNRWLAEYCNAVPGRLAGVAVVPIRDVGASVAEVRWAREAGLFGGVSLPQISDGFPMYNDRVYEPFWAACADMDVPINVHGASGPRFYGTGPDAMALIMAETDWFTRRALWFMIFSGVFERHPRLRLSITEGLAGWVPKVLSDLDAVYNSPQTAEVRQILPKPPSEYFHSNCYIGASFMSRVEADLREHVGVEKLMWGSDYPHAEGTWPWSLSSISKAMAHLPSEDIEQILGLNAARCYNFDTAALRPLADQVGPTKSDIERAPQDVDGAEFSCAFRDTGGWS